MNTQKVVVIGEKYIETSEEQYHVISDYKKINAPQKSNGKLNKRRLILIPFAIGKPCIKKCSSNSAFSQLFSSCSPPQTRLTYCIQIYEDRGGKKQVYSESNTNLPLIELRNFTFAELKRGIILPKKLNSTFYLRIFAIGNVVRRECIQLNCQFFITNDGYWPRPIVEKFEGQSLAPGTSVIYNGAIP